MAAAPNSGDAGDLVVGEDFSSLKISIGLTVTTKRPGARAVVEDDQPRMIEIRDDGVTLDLPDGICQAGDRLLFQVSAASPDGKKGSFSSPAQVIGVEPVSLIGDAETAEARVAVSIQYLLASGTGWASFRALLDSRQREIEEFMRTARGY